MTRSLVSCTVAAVFIIGLFLIDPGAIRERLHLKLHPRAELAYTYGLQHIDRPNESEYDLAEAAYFFSRAAHLDPQYPLVHHQLARIHFLNGEYHEALAEVNIEIQNNTHTSRSSAYYLRGLIEGYLNDYNAAARDYKTYVELNPGGWEGRTDYAWVLIKTGKLDEALIVVDAGLSRYPDNPWLLSVRATIFFEQGKLREALVAARRATAAVDGITPAQWHAAYPGNAPDAAETGLETLRNAAHQNLQKIESAATAKGIRE